MASTLRAPDAAEDDVLRLRDENTGLKRAAAVKDVALRRLATKMSLIESTLRRAHDGTAAQVDSASALVNLQGSVDSLTRRNRHLADKLRQTEEAQRQREQLRAAAIGRSRSRGLSAGAPRVLSSRSPPPAASSPAARGPTAGRAGARGARAASASSASSSAARPARAAERRPSSPKLVSAAAPPVVPGIGGTQIGAPPPSDAAAAIAHELAEVREALAARIDGGEQRLGQLTALVAELRTHGGAGERRASDGGGGSARRRPRDGSSRGGAGGSVTGDLGGDDVTMGVRDASGTRRRDEDDSATAASPSAATSDPPRRHRTRPGGEDTALAAAQLRVVDAAAAAARAATAAATVTMADAAAASHRRSSGVAAAATAAGASAWRSSTAPAQLAVPRGAASPSMDGRMSGGAPASARSAAAAGGDGDDDEDWTTHAPSPYSGGEAPPRARRPARPLAAPDAPPSVIARLERQVHERAAAAALLQSRVESLTAAAASERALHEAAVAQLEAQHGALRVAREALQRAEADAAALRARVAAAGEVHEELRRARSEVRRLEAALSELASSPFGAASKARETELEALRARCAAAEAARADADGREAAATAALHGARQEAADARRREQAAAAAELAANAQMERLRASLEAASTDSSALREQLALFAGTDLVVSLPPSTAATDGGAAGAARARLHSLQLALLSSQSEAERCERALRAQTAANEALTSTAAVERQQHWDEVEALRRRLAGAEALADGRLRTIAGLESRLDELQRHGGGAVPAGATARDAVLRRGPPPSAAAAPRTPAPSAAAAATAKDVDTRLSPRDVASLAAWLGDGRGGGIKPGLTIRFLAMDSDAAAALERLRAAYSAAAPPPGVPHPVAAALRGAGARPGTSKLHVDEVDEAWRSAVASLSGGGPAAPALRDVTNAVLSLAPPGHDGLRAAELLDLLARPPLSTEAVAAWARARAALTELATRTGGGSLDAFLEHYASAVTAALAAPGGADASAPTRLLTIAGLEAALTEVGLVSLRAAPPPATTAPPTTAGRAVVFSGVRLSELHPLVRAVLPSDDLFLLATPPDAVVGPGAAAAGGAGGHSWVLSASAAIDGEADAESWDDDDNDGGGGGEGGGGRRAVAARSWRMDLPAAAAGGRGDPDAFDVPFRLATTGTLFGGVQPLAAGAISLLDVLAGERSFIVPLAAAPCLCDVLDEGALPLGCTVVLVRVDVDLV